LSSGYSAIGVNVPRNYFTTDDQVVARVNLDNFFCRAACVFTTIKLVREVTIGFFPRNPQAKGIYTEVICEEFFDGINAKEKTEGFTRAIQLILQDRMQAKLNNI